MATDSNVDAWESSYFTLVLSYKKHCSTGLDIFFVEAFRSFFCWDISVICLTAVLKLAVTVFISVYLRHSDRNDIIFFGHFKNISVYNRKKNRVQVIRNGASLSLQVSLINPFWSDVELPPLHLLGTSCSCNTPDKYSGYIEFCVDAKLSNRSVAGARSPLNSESSVLVMENSLAAEPNSSSAASGRASDKKQVFLKFRVAYK